MGAGTPLGSGPIRPEAHFGDGAPGGFAASADPAPTNHFGADPAGPTEHFQPLTPSSAAHSASGAAGPSTAADPAGHAPSRLPESHLATHSGHETAPTPFHEALHESHHEPTHEAAHHTDEVSTGAEHSIHDPGVSHAGHIAGA
jgi:hypothetical protein